MSPIVAANKQHLPSLDEFGAILRATVQFGDIDSKCSANQHRVHLSSASLNMHHSTPEGAGFDFVRKLKELDGHSTVLPTIGKAVSFIWGSMDPMQQAAEKTPLAVDNQRYVDYAYYTNRLLGIQQQSNSTLGAVTAVSAILYPVDT
eukprot:14465555-Ditylum_brightwellii.AAC.1